MELDPAARRVLATRLTALSHGDMGMVRECEHQLARWGISIEEVTRSVEVPEISTPVIEKRVIPKVKVLSVAPSK